MAIVVTFVDLAGNYQSARVTALYSPLGYQPAAIQTAPGASLLIETAVDLRLNIFLRPPIGPAYQAPYSWQSRSDALQVGVET